MISNGINRLYNVGAYIRLSREDDDKENESSSIINQRSLLMQYVKENNLNLIDMYIDDGYSGTNFDRPGFKRMINDIEKNRINMVITKDMSRLGRDYIETGRYIEKYFPEKGVRYIAVTDNIDTFLDSSNNDIAPFKAIMNDMYAKDISKKIKTSFRAKQKEGKWVSGRCPFGYDIDPNDKNHLIINEEKAVVVKRIFRLASEGLTCYKIALLLTKEKVKTPASYYSFKWKQSYNINYNKWNSKTIKDILTNRMYLGDLVQNKRNKVNYKIKRVIKNNPDNYIIVNGTHEAIIDKDLFNEVQNILPKSVSRKDKKEEHLFDGLLYCGDCGHRIGVQPRRKKDNRCYTICNYYRTYINNNVCTTHSNNYDKLEKVLINSIKEECKKHIDYKYIKDGIKLDNLNIVSLTKIKKDIELLKEQIYNYISNLDDMYLDKINKIITEEQYLRVRQVIENDIKTNHTKLDDLNKKVKDINRINMNEHIVNHFINEFMKMKTFGRKLILELVEKVEIFDNKKINIKLRI